MATSNAIGRECALKLVVCGGWSKAQRTERHIDGLSAYDEERERPEATAGLLAAVERAAGRIERTSSAGLAAPRPDPDLARPGRLWIKEGAYWIAYSLAAPAVIVGVFHEASDIPGRA